MCKKSVYDVDESVVEEAVICIRRGGIVAFPTETCYGLAVDPCCEAAIARLFRIKKRLSSKPVLLLIESDEQLRQMVEYVPQEYLHLMNKYWPGPLTLVFSARSSVSNQITGGTGTVGVRISSHPVAQALVTCMGRPITATSANVSGMSPAQSASAVEAIFGGTMDYIIDGGKTESGLCSTLLGYKNNVLSILRQGKIDIAADLVMLESVQSAKSLR